MKIRITVLTLLVLVLATTIATTHSSSATAPDPGSSAFGQGTFFNNFQNQTWSFSFEAMANKNGQARGRATFNILEKGMETEVVVKINCLNVQSFSGINNALMTGTVLHSNDPDFPKRAKVIFDAEDSSGFPTIRPDTITPLFSIQELEGDCHDIGQPLTIFQISPDAITIEP